MTATQRSINSDLAGSMLFAIAGSLAKFNGGDVGAILETASALSRVPEIKAKMSVLARFKKDLFPAYVISAGDDSANLVWADNGEGFTAMLADLQPMDWQKGDKGFAKFSDGKWYPMTVSKPMPVGKKATIIWADSKEKEDVSLDRMCVVDPGNPSGTKVAEPEEPQFKAGDIVSAKFTDGKHYPASFVSVKGDQATIKWSDTGARQTVSLSDIRPAGNLKGANMAKKKAKKSAKGAKKAAAKKAVVKKVPGSKGAATVTVKKGGGRQ